MNGTELLLDTNAVITVLHGDPSKLLPSGRYFVSVITELELLSYPSITKAEEARIHDLILPEVVIELDQAIKAATVSVRKKHRLKLPDAIIAATASTRNLPLVTNDQHFQRIRKLTLLEIPVP